MTGAVERILAGAERHSRLLRPAGRYRVAVHEMRHALAAAPREIVALLPGRAAEAIMFGAGQPRAPIPDIPAKDIRQ